MPMIVTMSSAFTHAVSEFDRVQWNETQPDRACEIVTNKARAKNNCVHILWKNVFFDVQLRVGGWPPWVTVLQPT